MQEKKSVVVASVRDLRADEKIILATAAQENSLAAEKMMAERAEEKRAQRTAS